MKKFLAIAALSLIASTPVLAAKKADSQFAVGAGYGLGNGGVISVRGDYDISDRVNAPVKARVGWDHYSISTNLGFFGDYTWSYNVYYGGAYYDLNEIFKLDKKIHPFTGLGFGFGSASCSGTYCSGVSSPTVGGFYYIGGVQYNLTPQFDAEASFSGWTGVSLGANYKF